MSFISLIGTYRDGFEGLKIIGPHTLYISRPTIYYPFLTWNIYFFLFRDISQKSITIADTVGIKNN